VLTRLSMIVFDEYEDENGDDRHDDNIHDFTMLRC
jgi:hypothetical protein